MSNSWDWVEKHNRRERLRKRFSIFALIMMLCFLFFVVGIPPFFRFNDKDDNANNDAESTTTDTVVDERHEPRLPSNSASPEATGSHTAEFASSPIVSNNAGGTADTPDDSQPNHAVSGVTASKSAPIPPTVDPELLRAAERITARLKRRIEQVDGESRRLEKYGGDNWPSIQTRVDSALQSDDPAVEIRAAEQALELLDQLVPDLDYAEFCDQIRDRDHRDTLAAVVKFRKSHPEHPRLDELEHTLSQLTREKWLGMAAEELDQASPDDAGFAEGWLPIASAWQVVGHDREAREAVRRAIEALPRMTLPERVIESTIDICQHESFDPSSAQPLIENAARMCEEVSEKWDRGTYFAHLSGLSSKLGHPSLAAQYLEQAVSPNNMTVEFGVTEKLILTQQARAASWSQKPESIFAIAAKVEKLNYPKPTVNANAYAHAAIAAARHNDRTQFLQAMLLAANALAPVGVYEYPNYLFAVRFAEANILQRRWRAAVIVANNIPDPYIRASLLLRVMKSAPQEIRTRNLSDLFQSFAEQRWASPACAGHAEHRIRSGDSLLAVAAWTQSLPLASQRAAAFAGIARTVGTPRAKDSTDAGSTLAAPVDINDVHSLMDAAERVAHQIQEPLDAAFVWIQIARTWNLLGKTQRYQQALTNLDDRVFDAWTGVWQERPPVKRGYNGGYIDSSDRHRTVEQHTIGLIIACHRHLAEMQADMGDSRGAMESCLNLANAAGFLNETATFNDLNFLYLKALLNRLQGATDVGPDAVPLLEHRSYRYTRALVAAWGKDIPALEAALPKLVEHSHRKLGSANERAQPARAYGELALLHAERGNIDAYRKARRSAQSLISQGRAGSEMNLILATADAQAGEFALAESNLVRGTLGWFGDANRPRKQLVVSLANDGQCEKAEGHAKMIAASQPLYRAEAWAAVAEARRKDRLQSPTDLLDWVDSLESQVDRAAVYCGLSLAIAPTR